MAEEEVRAEVEAVEAVYVDDCQVIDAYPPHLLVHLKPRTAEDSSQQFVEATIGIRAGPQYPEVPPEISIIDSKGLDDQRQKHLLACIHGKSLEFASCLMIVALFEEAVERLSSMNHPDGDCPLCLHPLLDEEDDVGSSLPFMKLMSCFHCFHCDCIMRWWNWNRSQSEKETSSSSSSSRIKQHRQENIGMCPVCRKVFHAKDIEHVLDLVDSGGHLDDNSIENAEDLLHSDSEKIRREKFEAILKLQQENSGLIEPKKDVVLLPGMFLPVPIASPSTESDPVSSESQKKDTGTKSEANPGSSFSRHGPRKHSNSNTRKHHRTHNPAKQTKNWMKKDEVSKN